ncbi:MAG: hypothetical protein ACK4TI_01275, partial [Nitrososphaerales archaeon]
METIELERNELGFFSLWSKQIVRGNLIFLYNPLFSDDPLFNHALPKDNEVILTQHDCEYVKSFYKQLKIRPALFLLEKKSQGQQPLDSDFKVLDTLLTMTTLTRSHLSLNPNIKVSTCSEVDLEDWIKVFIDA